MKTLLSLLTSFLLNSFIQGQEFHIQTESIKIDDFFSYVVSHSAKHTDNASPENIVFLIETYGSSFSSEDKTVLKHGLKFLTERLSNNSFVSIVGYSKYDGVILERAETSNIKLILSSIENTDIKPHETIDDGIELAYHMVKANYIPEGNNTVVMVRIPDSAAFIAQQETLHTASKSNRGNNTVVLTAIALLPELIKVIKD